MGLVIAARDSDFPGAAGHVYAWNPLTLRVLTLICGYNQGEWQRSIFHKFGTSIGR